MRLLKVTLLAIFFSSIFVLLKAEEDISWQIEEYLDGYSEAYFSAHYQKAIDLGEDALYVIENKFGKVNPNAAAMRSNLGTLYKFQGKLSEAENYYKKALEIYEKTLGLDNSYCAKLWNALGENYQARRKYNEAEKSYKNAQNVWDKNFGKDNYNTVLVSSHMGSLYKDQRKYKEAETILKNSLQAMAKGYGQSNPILIRPLTDLGKLYESEGKDMEAEQYYRYAWALFKGNFMLEDPSVQKAYYRMKQEMDRQWNQRSEPIYKRLMDLNDLYIGPWHPDAPDILNNLPMLYLKEERYTEAENIYEDSLEIMLSNLGPNHLNVVKVLRNMAKFYRKMGKLDKSKELETKAESIRKQIRY